MRKQQYLHTVGLSASLKQQLSEKEQTRKWCKALLQVAVMLNSEAQMPIQKNSRYVKLLVSQMIVQLFSLIFIDLKLNVHQTRTTQFQTELIKQW